jgi:hypothetical protein
MHERDIIRPGVRDEGGAKGVSATEWIQSAVSALWQVTTGVTPWAMGAYKSAPTWSPLIDEQSAVCSACAKRRRSTWGVGGGSRTDGGGGGEYGGGFVPFEDPKPDTPNPEKKGGNTHNLGSSNQPLGEFGMSTAAQPVFLSPELALLGTFGIQDAS